MSGPRTRVETPAWVFMEQQRFMARTGTPAGPLIQVIMERPKIMVGTPIRAATLLMLQPQVMRVQQQVMMAEQHIMMTQHQIMKTQENIIDDAIAECR